MRVAAFFLIGIATVATASAQSGPARVVFLPMSNSLPAMLFAPDPLAGTLLRPLPRPATDSNAFAEVRPEPAVIAIVADQPVTGDPIPPTTSGKPKPKPTLVQDPVTDPTSTAATTGSDIIEDTPAIEAAPTAPGEIAIEPAPAVPPPAPPPVTVNPKESTVTVIVENVESSSGVVNVALCDKGLSHEGCSYFREVKAAPGFVQTEFDKIPPGNYAVVAYHDVNGNNQFDQFMKIPREPYALSSKAADELVPSFADAALPIKSGENAVIIRLKRLGG